MGVDLEWEACSTRSAGDGRDGINPQVGFDVHEIARSYRLPSDVLGRRMERR
jgi:hypothetical protein